MNFKLAILVIFFFKLVLAQDSGVSKVELPKMQLKSKFQIRPDEEVVDKKIISGKKVNLVSSEMIPSLPNNNMRQVLGDIPGVISSEVNNESFLSITTRGLGDPHESFNILLLRNGLPAAADPYGYPAAYYAPPAEALESVSFYRGGAGLLFGPQPGGAFDLKLKVAPENWQKLKVETTNLVGSFGRFSSYTESTKSDQNFSHLVSFHIRSSEGFREANSRSQVINPRANLRWDINNQRSIAMDIEYFEGDYAEPGGILRTDSYLKTTLKNDKLEIERSQISLSWDEEMAHDWSLKAQAWATQLDRTSFRQTLGGAPAFGGEAIGSENRIQSQKFNLIGSDFRIQKKYEIRNQAQDLTFGWVTTSTESPFTQINGPQPQATNGLLTRKIDRQTNSAALIVENAFRTGKLTVTPGLRFEEIQQNINEKLNLIGTQPLRKSQNTEQVALMGFGMEYELSENYKSFLNLSEGYKPASFQDSMPLGTGDTVSENIEEARTWTRELGIRMNQESTSGELSAFDVQFSNQIGRVGSEFKNVGKSHSEGIDLNLQHQLNSKIQLTSGLSLLKAQIVGGPLKGKKNQYSPEQMMRLGVIYKIQRDSQIQIQNQWLSEHYGDDANSENYKIPSYTLFDLSGEHKLAKILDSKKTIFKWGVQNLFDQKYFSRVRSTGIEPGNPRSLYGGLTLVY